MVEDVRFDQSPTAYLYKDKLIIGVISTH